jgi:hypothetical protein
VSSYHTSAPVHAKSASDPSSTHHYRDDLNNAQHPRPVKRLSILFPVRNSKEDGISPIIHNLPLMPMQHSEACCATLFPALSRDRAAYPYEVALDAYGL